MILKHSYYHVIFKEHIIRKSKYSHIKCGDIYKTLPVLGVWKSESGHHIGKFLCICNRPFYRKFSNIDRKEDPRCDDCNKYLVAKSKEKFIIKDKRLYGIWKSMNARCKNKDSSGYEDYGGRGIKVCERWDDETPEGFNNFYNDIGMYPTINHSIDRINVNGNYTPDNVRWLTSKGQMNNVRNNHNVEWKGTSYTISELSELVGVKSNTLLYRIRRGWSLEDAVRGEREKEYKRPYHTKLTEIEFKNLLMDRLVHHKGFIELSKTYGVDQGNLSKVFRDEKMLDFYKEVIHDYICK